MGSPEIADGEEGGCGVAALAVAERMGSKEIEENPTEAETMGVEVAESIGIKVEEDEDDDGPPPGWQHIVPSPPPLSPTEITGSKKLEDGKVKVEISGDQERISKEIEGKVVSPAHLTTMENDDINEERGEGEEVNPVHGETVRNKQIKEEGEEDDDGPPPGWHPIDHSPSKLSPSLPSTGSVGSREIEKVEEVKADTSGDQVRMSSKGIKGEETVSASIEGVKNEEIKEEDDDGPPPGWQPVVHSSPGQSPSIPPTEMAQMVCGFCRQLLSYPRGARHVKCSSCQTINLVLEEHQVGQVECDNCTILLMYPYGAPSVRCSCCRFVTQIGDHNIRPPWSTQQGRPIPTPHPVQ